MADRTSFANKTTQIIFLNIAERNSSTVSPKIRVFLKINLGFLYVFGAVGETRTLTE
jgi:hypothetical protein